jgi:hypothetical protein
LGAFSENDRIAFKFNPSLFLLTNLVSGAYAGGRGLNPNKILKTLLQQKFKAGQ